MRDGEEGKAIRTNDRSAIMTPRLMLRPPAGATAAVDRDARRQSRRRREPCRRAPGRRQAARSFAVVERRDRGGRRLHRLRPDGRPAGRDRGRDLGRRAHWGRGYATEATQAVIDRAFADDRHRRSLWCSNRASNGRARRVIEKCGFQFRETGMVRSPTRGAVPVERFVLERRNWASLKSWGARRGAQEERDAPRNNAA